MIHDNNHFKMHKFCRDTILIKCKIITWWPCGNIHWLPYSWEIINAPLGTRTWDRKYTYTLHMKHSLQVNNHKHGKEAKFWDYTQQRIRTFTWVSSSQKWHDDDYEDGGGGGDDDDDYNDRNGSSSVTDEEQVHFAKCLVGSHTDDDVMRIMQTIHMPNYYNPSILRTYKVVMLK
jgi:hypothetical protein